MIILKSLPLLLAASALATSDPAQNATPYEEGYALYRSANMDSADMLPDGRPLHSFRIPAVVTTNTGRVIAFSEGRQYNSEDYGAIHLSYKRTRTTSSGGATIDDWEDLRTVVGRNNETWGNPCPVVDGSTIFLFMSWNGANYSEGGNDTLPDGVVTKKVDTTWEGRRHLYLSQSTDDGDTWTDPEDLTCQLTPDGWSWDAVGPGQGIETTSGDLVVPAQERNIIGRGTPGNRTWSTLLLPDAGSEGTVAETFDGNLYRNDRAIGKKGYRIVSRGTLDSFGPFENDTELVDPGCEGSTVVYNRDDDKGPSRLLFLNSDSQTVRTEMRIQITYDDDAAHYTAGRNLSDAPIANVGIEGGYSSICKTPDDRVGAMVETNWNDGVGSAKHFAIVWRRMNLSWILNGQ